MGTKLDYSKVRSIRKSYELGITQEQLAREFNLSVTYVGRIVRGACWQEAAVPFNELSEYGKYKKMAADYKRMTGEDYTIPFIGEKE